MKIMNRSAIVAACMSALLGIPALAADKAPDNLDPLPVKLPKPAYSGTPKNKPDGLGRFELPTGKPRPAFLAPRGCVNLAAERPVTSSDPEPSIGKLEQITDGDKEGRDACWVEMAAGKQWVQIDLGAVAEIHAVLVWHFHCEPRVYKGIVVQIADDPDFIDNVRTVYNNDQDNSVGLGIGSDLQYFENHEGRLMPVAAVKGRYVRLWSRGSTASEMNHYTEVEVWGLPAKP